MTQLVQEQLQPEARLRISGETLVYAAILIFTLVIRVAMLGAVPLDDAQAHEALAALHRIDPSTSSINPDEPLLPDNALGSLFNSLSMLIFGSNDEAARLATALAGSLLVISPALYRRYFGRVAVLFMSLALMVSPAAIATARSMSATPWSMLLVMVGGWLALRFAETREKWFALGTAVCFAGIIFLTSEYGIFIVLGLFFGLAVSLSDQEEVRRVFADWPYFESFMAVLVTIIVVSTAFLASPGGLSSVGQVLEKFAEGLSTRHPNTPYAYGLLVVLRYEIGWVVFALISVWVTWREGTLLERFLAGWLAWSLLCVTFYLGATAEMSLLVTIPAAALTAALAARLTQEVSFGYWNVPGWFIPLHAVIVAALVGALTVSVQSLALKLHDEAKVQPFAKVLNFDDAAVRIGTISPEADSSMVINLPYIKLVNCESLPADDPRTADLVPASNGQYCEEDITPDTTIQVVPLDAPIKNARFVIRDPEGETVYGPEPIGDELLTVFTAADRGEYRFEVLRGETIDRQAQYILLVHRDDLTDKSGFSEITSGAVALRFPELNAALRIFARNNFNPAAVIVVPLVLLLLPITFFLGGALYGARAAWRGMGFGFMLSAAVFGVSIGWNLSTTSEVRDLWTPAPATQDYQSLEDTLEAYSRRDNGTKMEMEITVEGPSDGALAWSLRHFDNANYVDAVGPHIVTPAVITRDVFPRPVLGADYVGQQLVFGEAWDRGSLNWTDFGAWWFQRRTRFEPVPDHLWRLWIRKEVYDVQTVPEG